MDKRQNMKDMDSDYYMKYGETPEPVSIDDMDDVTISFKNPDTGVIRWDWLKECIEDKRESYQKAQSSIYRAKSTIYDLMQSNYWDYFVTITVNPNAEYMTGVDIKDVHEVQKKVTKLINNLNSRRNSKINYVLIPEYQENGNVHFHGVISGVSEKDLKIAINNQEFRKDDKGNIMLDKDGNPIRNEFYMKPLIRKGNQVYNHQTFNKVGYNDFEIIRDMSRVGSYCTKYITKDLLERSNEYGAHLYICSKGLERKKEIYSRYTEEYKQITDKEIKDGIDENAYIVRSDYSTKVFISKKYLKDKEKIIKFADSIEVNSVNQGIEDVSGTDKRIDYEFLSKLSPDELTDIGINKYNAESGEIEISKNKKPIERRIYDSDTDTVSVISESQKSFKDSKSSADSILSVKIEQLPLY